MTKSVRGRTGPQNKWNNIREVFRFNEESRCYYYVRHLVLRTIIILSHKDVLIMRVHLQQPISASTLENCTFSDFIFELIALIFRIRAIMQRDVDFHWPFDDPIKIINLRLHVDFGYK